MGAVCKCGEEPQPSRRLPQGSAGADTCGTIARQNQKNWRSIVPARPGDSSLGGSARVNHVPTSRLLQVDLLYMVAAPLHAGLGFPALKLDAQQQPSTTHPAAFVRCSAGPQHNYDTSAGPSIYCGLPRLSYAPRNATRLCPVVTSLPFAVAEADRISIHRGVPKGTGHGGVGRGRAKYPARTTGLKSPPKTRSHARRSFFPRI